MLFLFLRIYDQMFSSFVSSKHFLIALAYCLLPITIFPSWDLQALLLCLNNSGSSCHREKKCNTPNQTISCCAKKEKRNISFSENSCCKKMSEAVSTSSIHSETCQCLKLSTKLKTIRTNTEKENEKLRSLSAFAILLLAFESGLFSKSVSHPTFFPIKQFPPHSPLQKNKVLLL